MKYFVPFITIGLLFCLFSCDAGKSGPFTFTNKTEASVNVIIIQDGTVEKTFSDGEQYTGQDYYTPRITFVKGLDSADNKKIIDNRYTYTSASTFDYVFVMATKQNLEISATLKGDYTSNEATQGDTCYLTETNGKLGEYSDTTVKLSEIQTSSKSTQLYTSNPQFRIYNGSGQDVTDLFTISLGKETEPTLQWNLVISYPKVESVD